MHFVSISELMGPDWRFLADHCSDPTLTWECFSGRPPKNRSPLYVRMRISLSRATRQGVKAVKAHSAGVLVSHLPNVTLRANLLRNRVAREKPHIAFAFNFTDMPTSWRKMLYRQSLKTVDEFVVFSNFERQLYSTYFDLPAERFRFLPWAMDMPYAGSRVDVPFDRPYLIAIGGEARDYGTLIRAVTEAPELRLVVVGRKASVAGLSIPDNVKLYQDIPPGVAWGLASKSSGMVLPLRSDRTPNGHITLVGAQLMGLPLAITRSLGVSDYVDETNAFLIEPHDAGGLRQRLREMLDDRPHALAKAAEARRRASAQNSIATWVDYFAELRTRSGFPSGL